MRNRTELNPLVAAAIGVAVPLAAYSIYLAIQYSRYADLGWPGTMVSEARSELVRLFASTALSAALAAAVVAPFLRLGSLRHWAWVLAQLVLVVVLLAAVAEGPWYFFKLVPRVPAELLWSECHFDPIPRLTVLSSFLLTLFLSRRSKQL